MSFEQPSFENQENNVEEKDLETMISKAFDTTPTGIHDQLEEIIGDREKIINELAELQTDHQKQLDLFDERVVALEGLGLSPDLLNNMRETSRLMRRDSRSFLQRLGGSLVSMIKATTRHFSHQN
ncbi:MAG: hypothetical protein AAB453_01530 [Patescibacteria group bacterium]